MREEWRENVITDDKKFKIRLRFNIWGMGQKLFKTNLSYWYIKKMLWEGPWDLDPWPASATSEHILQISMPPIP